MRASKNLTRLLGLASLVVLTFLAGCGQQTDFTYGKAADQSVNGLSVFANLLREQGHTVVRKRRLTRRLQSFDSIVWAPDNEFLPPESVAAWMEDWLSSPGTSKVLIFIGRSYDAKIPFYESKVRAADPEDREDWQRELAEVIVDAREFDFGWSFAKDTETTFWFDSRESERPFAKSVTGPWAKGVDTGRIDLHCSKTLVPLETYDDEEKIPSLIPEYAEDNQFYEYETYDGLPSKFRDPGLKARDLLTVDGQPFAFEISSDAGNGRIIVISNGSFLFNFPLLNPEHQELAKMVAGEVTGDVVFLESGIQWPRVGGAANDPALQWSWIGKAPMTYIVPHFLFWGVLYIFAFFPNFGRPKRLKFHPAKAFRNHVQAVAAILRRSKERDWARNAIETWHKRNKS